MNEKAFGLIGLARRAGKLSPGEAAAKDAVRSGRAKLVILAEDAADNTKKSIKNSCSFYKVNIIEDGTAERLGHAIGTACAAAVSINDYNLAKAVSDKINQG